MASEIEFVNYKQFVESLDEADNFTSLDKSVISNGTNGPRSLNALKFSLAVDEKNLPSAVFQLARNLHTESTKFVDGTGVVYESGRISSGLIPVNEGDIFECKESYKWRTITGVAADGKTSVSITARLSGDIRRAVVPSGVSYVFLGYKYGDSGNGLDVILRRIPADSSMLLQYEHIGNRPDLNAINKKFVPVGSFVKVSDLYNEKTKFVDGTGVVNDSTRISSGLIPVNEGDVFYFQGALHYVFLVASDKVTAVANTSGNYLTNSRLIIPSGVSYVFLSYTNGSSGDGLAVSVKRLTKENFAKLEEVGENFESGNIGVNGPSVNASKIRCPHVVIPGCIYDVRLEENSSLNVFRVVYEYSDGTYALGSTPFLATSTMKRVWVVLQKNNSSDFDNVEVDEAIVFFDMDYGGKDDSVQEFLYRLVVSNKEVLVKKGDFSDLVKKNSILLEKLSLLDSEVKNIKTIVKDASNYVVPESVSEDSITGISGSPKKMIVNLHKISRGDYSKANDFYLPFAKDSFGDVAFFDQNGKQLAYSLISKCKGFDIVPDSRLKFMYNVLKNGYGQVFGQTSRDGDPDNKFLVSSDNGVTWSEIPAFENILNHQNMMVVADDNSLIVSVGTGQVYRSEYPYTSASMVVDLTVDSGVDERCTSENCAVASDGTIFIGSYQTEAGKSAIYKSTDNGVSWTIVKRVSDYQHVHRIRAYDIDENIVVYVGVDAGITGCGSVLKSADMGDTWEDLGYTYSLRGGVDHGVIYYENGVRYLAGETSVNGVPATSLRVTNDDVHFENSFTNGKPVYDIIKVGDVHFAVSVLEPPFRTTEILISYDGMKTWKSIKNTEPSESSMASGGYHSLTAVGDEVWVYNRVADSLYSGYNERILFGANMAFAEFILDVPEGVTSITARTGYALPNRVVFESREKCDGTIFYAPLNENSKYSRFVFKGGDFCFENNYQWSKKGRRVSNFTPNLRSFVDDFSAVVSENDFWFDLENLLASGGYHLSFWIGTENGKQFDSNFKMNILRDANNELNVEGYRLYARGSGTSYSNCLASCAYYDTCVRVDIDVDSNMVGTVYVNGQKIGHQVQYETLTMPAFSGKVNFLNNVGTNKVVMQHFCLSLGNWSDKEVLDGYYAGL